MIICAALCLKPDNIIICGLRHSDCYETLYCLNPDLSKKARKENLIIDGFITTENQFLDRAQAYQHALKCGQISSQLKHDKNERKENILYSEDLY